MTPFDRLRLIFGPWQAHVLAEAGYDLFAVPVAAVVL